MNPILSKKQIFSLQSMNILFFNAVIFGWYIFSEQNLLGLIVLVGVEMLIIAAFSALKDFLYLTESMRVEMKDKGLFKTLGIFILVMFIISIVYGGYLLFFAYGSVMIFFVGNVALAGSSMTVSSLLAEQAAQQAVLFMLVYQTIHFLYQTFFDKRYFKFSSKEGNELPFFRQFFLQTFLVIVLGLFLVLVTGIVYVAYFVLTDLPFDVLISHPVVILSLGIALLLAKTYMDTLWEHRRPGSLSVQTR